MNSTKTVFQQTWNRIRIFFSLKQSWDQDKDNNIRYNPIGSAVFELLSYIQTDIQTNKHPVALVLDTRYPITFE